MLSWSFSRKAFIAVAVSPISSLLAIVARMVRSPSAALPTMRRISARGPAMARASVSARRSPITNAPAMTPIIHARPELKSFTARWAWAVDSRRFQSTCSSTFFKVSRYLARPAVVTSRVASAFWCLRTRSSTGSIVAEYDSQAFRSASR